MERYRVFDGTHWRSICGCGFHVRDTSGNWQLVDPDNCQVKYYSDGVWKEIKCCYDTLVTSCNITASYCASTKLLVEVVFPQVILNDRTTDILTCQELDSITCPPEPNSVSAWITLRDTFLNQQLSNFQATLVGLPAPYVLNYAGLAASPLPYKGTLKKINVTAWCPASEYPEWTVPDPITLLSPDDVMPGVTDFTFLPSVENVLDLPPTGNAGEAIYVRLPVPVAYAWDPGSASWSVVFYNTYFDPIQSIRIATFNAAYIQKKSIALALWNFMMASFTIPYHLLRKKTIETSCS